MTIMGNFGSFFKGLRHFTCTNALRLEGYGGVSYFLRSTKGGRTAMVPSRFLVRKEATVLAQLRVSGIVGHRRRESKAPWQNYVQYAVRRIHFRFPSNLKRYCLLPREVDETTGLGSVRIFQFFRTPILPQDGRCMVFVAIFPLLRFFRYLRSSGIRTVLIFTRGTLNFSNSSRFTTFLFFFHLGVLIV